MGGGRREAEGERLRPRPTRSPAPANGLSAERFDLILPTESGLRTRLRDCLPGSIRVVCGDAIAWTRDHRADVWCTLTKIDGVRGFPPGLMVWGRPCSRAAFQAQAIPFVPLPYEEGALVMGPFGIPRPADAFFHALDFACEHLGARLVRVHGCSTWNKADRRWKRHALAQAVQTAARHGIEIQRVG